MNLRNPPLGRVYSGNRMMPPGLITRPNSFNPGIWSSSARAKQECSNCRIERLVRKVELRDVHDSQLDLCRRQSSPSFGPGYHRWANINSNNFCIGRVKWEVSTRANTSIQES